MMAESSNAKKNRSSRPETLTQVFSCEFCEIFKNNYSYRTPPVAASQRAAEAYSEPCQTFKIESFVKIVNRKTLHLRCFDRVLNMRLRRISEIYDC